MRGCTDYCDRRSISMGDGFTGLTYGAEPEKREFTAGRLPGNGRRMPVTRSNSHTAKNRKTATCMTILNALIPGPP